MASLINLNFEEKIDIVVHKNICPMKSATNPKPSNIELSLFNCGLPQFQLPTFNQSL